MSHFRCDVLRVVSVFCNLILDLGRLVRTAVRSRAALSAEILFLRKQLAFYQEHEVKPRRLTDSARAALLALYRLFNWRDALVIVKPETLILWHRKGFRLFWRWKCRSGRPRLPQNIRQLIAQMALENPTWGQARVAAELMLKLGIWVSPRTVRAYWPPEPERRGPKTVSSQRWKNFVHNHARAILACDFLVAVTAGFRILYVFVVLEVGTRRIAHFNVTAHPTAEWTLQQFREAIPSDHAYCFLIHDRDTIYSAELDQAVEAMGVKVLKTPVGPTSQCLLRTADRHDATRMPRFPDSAQRAAPPGATQKVGCPLQWRAPTLQFGTRYSRALCRVASSSATNQALVARRASGPRRSHSRWTASRIPLGEDCRLRKYT